MKRCTWCNPNNPVYVDYHDNEWGRLNLAEDYLFETLLLESFQAGLSWECVLNKREAFRRAFDNFDIDKIIAYDEDKINELASDKAIIRNGAKIRASVNNAKIFRRIQNEYGSFKDYLLSFTHGTIIYENDKTTDALSDDVSADLYKRGMRFVGSTIIYSYLQAIGLIYSHQKDCYLYKCK